MAQLSHWMKAGIFLVALAACGDDATPAPDAGTRDAGNADAGRTGRVPVEHRAAALECDHARGPGNADPTIGGPDCTTDAECTAGDNGRCLVSFGGAYRNFCSYDACFLDTECASSEVCRCRESAMDANICVGGNCVLDADCGVGAYCSPSRGFDRINLPADAYWCHTSGDECVDDADCVVDAGSDARCVWYPDRTHWACSSMGFFPP